MPIININKFIKRGVDVSRNMKLRNLTPIEYQERTLRKLLRKAALTAFGEHYNFKEILDADNIAEQFQHQVPIFDYDSIYGQWWHRTLNEEEDICWPGKIKYFALSSGTSGTPSKHIPITQDLLRSHRRGSLRLFTVLPNYQIPPSIYSKGIMLLGGSTALEPKGGYYVGDLSGITASKIPFWFRPFYKPGVEIAAEKDWDSRITKIAENAPNWDIGIIGGIPSWIQLLMERIIEYHGVNTIHDIWPNLEVFISGGIAFEPYRKSFDRLTNRPLKIIDTYLASEGYVSIQSRPEAEGMKMLLNNGVFFEFVPFNENNFDENGKIIGKPKALTIAEVEENVDYALLMSTNAGIWRYQLGDTIRFVDKARSEIIITGRTQHFLSICGEHLSVLNMTDAVNMVAEELNVTALEFTVAGVRHDNFFAHKWYIGCDEPVDKTIFRDKLDAALKVLNADYETERTAVLKEVIVEIIPTDIFYDWHKKRGKMGGQNKFPRVMKVSKFKEWEAFVDEMRTKV
jgi:hypothetical protein